MEGKFFIDLSVILIVTVLMAGLMRVLRQPIIIGYLFTGIVLSPFFLNVVEPNESIVTFSQLGVTLLLFMVGLNLNPRLVRDVGKVALITGLAQVGLTFVIGFFLSKLFGFDDASAFYIGIAIAFSSTIVIMKLLSDKGDLETLYGRIAIGLLIVQDIIAMVVLIVISSMSNGFNVSSIIFDAFIKGMGLSAILVLVGIYIVPRVAKTFAKSPELLMLFSIAWFMSLASLFELIGFSMEIGALIAGFTLSISPYRYEMSSRMKPLRDFFLVMFFVLLGSQMVFKSPDVYLLPVVVFSVLILLIKPLIMMILMGFLGYKKKNSFLAGVTIAQISEFSLIIVAMGVAMGHVKIEILSLMTMVGLVTIGGSSYFISYSNKLYKKLSPYLSIFEKKGRKVDEHKYHGDEEYDILLMGFSRIGMNLLDSFKKMNKKFLVVDYNPEVIVELAKEGIDCRYGDVSDVEILDELNFRKAKMIISTLKEYETNILLLKKVRDVNKDAIVIVVSHQLDEAMHMYKLGASYVLMPNFIGGYHTSILLEEYGFDLNKFLAEKAKHMKDLTTRKEKGHERGIHD